MEDEGFVDDDFIAETARDYVIRYGESAAAMLHERAAIATRAGDFLLAQTWREMAETAERMIVELG